jgi:putative transposase
MRKAKEIYINLLTKSNQVEYKNVFESPHFMRKFKISISAVLQNILKKKDEKIQTLDSEILKFQKKKRKRNPDDIRAKKYLIEQLLANGHKITEIASLLMISRRSVYNILTSHNERR